MRSVLALRAGIRVNPAETEWKRPLRHIAQFLMLNVGLFSEALAIQCMGTQVLVKSSLPHGFIYNNSGRNTHI